jgi:hypothetical protein
MFIPQQKIRRIVKKAHEDVLLALESLLKDPDNVHYWPRSGWLDALSAVREIDQGFLASNVRLRRPRDFVEPFLDWLELRRSRRLAPWIDSGGQLQISGDSPCLWFLEFFHHTLGDMVQPGHEGKRMNGPHISGRLRDLGTLVAKRRLELKRWTLTFYPKPPNESLRGYASWLIVYREGKELHIMYDADLIAESDPPTDTVVERLEKIFLHELGHARCDLGFYLRELERAHVSQLIPADPVHETHAWLYTHAVRAFISSARARVCRLIHDRDDEWP